jgi:catechol 2,3-dioxygenase-like lactoylglutathione lyase family enzyme
VTAGAPAGEPRPLELRGLHHVTVICSSLDRSTAFYRDVLGLRLVREDVSVDDPGARHFWFGDAEGTVGTVVSCLEYPRMEQGVVGRGSTHHVAFTVGSREELAAWVERGVAYARSLPAKDGAA